MALGNSPVAIWRVPQARVLREHTLWGAFGLAESTPAVFMSAQKTTTSILDSWLSAATKKTPLNLKNLLPLLHSEVRSVLSSRFCAATVAAPRRRGSQVVRQESAKLLCVGSIPTPASNLSPRDWKQLRGFLLGTKFRHHPLVIQKVIPRTEGGWRAGGCE